jgi:hypothetical protein
MPYILNFPASEPDFWHLHLHLLDAAAAQLKELRGHTSGAGRYYADALRKVDAATNIRS